MYPRVREILQIYDKSGYSGVKEYFNNSDLIVDPSTWAGHIKKSIDKGITLSVSAELELLLEKFKL